MYKYLVCAIAFDRLRNSWFSTKQVLDYIPDIDRRKCSTITNTLTRGAGEGLFEKKKVGGRWRFKITDYGEMIGRWAYKHAADFDEDVRKYTVEWQRQQAEARVASRR